MLWGQHEISMMGLVFTRKVPCRQWWHDRNRHWHWRGHRHRHHRSWNYWNPPRWSRHHWNSHHHWYHRPNHHWYHRYLSASLYAAWSPCILLLRGNDQLTLYWLTCSLFCSAQA